MIEFCFDIVCPYAWVASRRLAWLTEVTGLQVQYRPILLGGVLRSVGGPDRPMDEMAPLKAEYTVRDVLRQARREGLELRYPADHPRRTVEAMRLLTAAPAERVPALAQDLWEAYWSRGEDLTDRAVLAGLAAAHGVELAAIDAPSTRARLRAATQEAVDAGVFGVPMLRSGQHRVWGSDRIVSFARDLGAQVEPALPRGPLEVYHDFSSPYSYLGVMTLLRSGASITLRPMLLGALFKSIGTPMVPIATFNPTKQRYAAIDLEAQARFRGFPFRFTDHFPLHTITALRVALIEPATTEALYLAAWADNRNIADPAVLRGVLDAAGFDGAALIAGTSDPAIKSQLRENTEQASARGIPGAPGFIDAAGEVYWGQDRLDLIAYHESQGA